MILERLQSADKRLILAVALAAAASITYTIFNYQAAFPEASIDLRLSRTEITSLAEKFLRQRGLSTAGFRNLTIFDADQEASVYLEREVGLTEANRLMSTQVAVWRWRARWFRPPDQEEMLVYLSPKGVLTGFSHVIPEAAPGARLEKNAARALAEAFLKERTSTPQRLIEEQLQERPARYDYIFTWEQEGFKARDATYRRTIVVQGDQAGRYSEYLYVPEKWKRDYALLRSSNDLYAMAATVLYALLAVAAIVVLIQSLRRRELRWKPLLIIAGTVGALMIANEWNSVPFAIDSMPTSSPYLQSLVRALLLGLGAGVGVFFYVILAAAPGEPLYRRLLPDHLPLSRIPERAAIRTREFFLATVAGYGFAAVHIAYVVAFYLVGRRFGVWSPQDINYSDFLSTRLPWIYPLTIALLASTSEEFWFRLFAIPLLKKYLKSTWLAVLIPAFLWGFLHSNYPQQPGYIRGVEVGVIGVAAGFLMLRFGILATLIWHYVVDAVMIGMFLIRAESWYFRLSGWLVGGIVLFPLAISLFYYRRRGGFLPATALLEQVTEPPPPAVPTEEASPVPVQARRAWPVKWLYIAAAVAALAGLLVRTPPSFGDFIRVRVTRTEAEAVAVRELGARVENLRDWRRVTEFVANLSDAEFEYLRRIAGAHAANEAVRSRTRTGVWVVRFFRPMQKEEWRVLVDQQARAVRVDHVLDEKAPGANLSAAEAQRIAEASLLRQGIPINQYRLVDSSIDKKDRRTDHSFVWEDPGFRLGDARARVSLEVQGDEVSGFRPFLKLPEEWLRDYGKPRLSGLLIPAALGAVGLLVLVLLIRRIGSGGHRYAWRSYLALAVGAAIASALAALNQWPLALSGYDTATPLDRYVSSYVLTRVMAALLAGFAMFLAALAADLFLQWARPGGAASQPSLLGAIAICALMWGLDRVMAGLGAVIPGPRLSAVTWQLPGADTLSPAITVFGQAFLVACLTLCGLIVAVSAAAKFLRPSGWYACTFLAAAVYAGSRSLTVVQFVFYFAVVALITAVLYALIQVCDSELRTFGVALFWLIAFEPAALLSRQPATLLKWNGIAAAIAAVVLGVVLLRIPELLHRSVKPTHAKD